ncbi:MAG: hypothetical protein A2381_10675 [Bdellovibrionales bacterium RIFOXYB1_FULL_37_110]|nr:MAG: hypothetical protein A2181_06815 [Bdellovibrionales bacterium RIFOXYA1_FULL_38_20]OFZ51129.1 MAG: hypothetical protein A2417_17655 [Bdellovibrionales bacterium RIFOXYC1_FULL_37_79]OFZ52718.1 MAG: hypothetical protein A2328_08220 [Bdellovibrionales bacterium RIFOXYB2_FULL_36_6]OFZ61236.1 MAG: hypothetical protein A2381_10675 [Bdellovibrionales bacterium RIFOXYB1_FULL_37_110]OFZ62099.1 MAG: hypothetical protein A2577_14250 [Bdellovibrionales bacterium RIFOXYD1_FULL_36_51]
MCIYDYIDYKQFLSDHFQSKKVSRADYSYGIWAKNLNLKTTASLTMIVNGDRHPGPKLQKHIVSYFKFNKEEADYFADLVQLKKSESKDIALHLGLLRKIKSRNSIKCHLLSEEVFSRICSWYYFALREMINLENFQNDPEWITNKLLFQVKTEDIEKAIKDLKALGLIREDKDGKLKNCTDGLNTYDEIPSKSIRQFHKQMLKNAETALDKIDVDKRYVSALTIPVNSKKLAELKKYVQKVENEILEMFTDKHPDSIYQINLQFFPLTKSEEEI